MKFEIKYDNVAGLSCDSAHYMTACAKNLKAIINSELLHVQCWSHKIDKLNKICPDKFPRLNEFISKTKKVFKNTRKRKYKYTEFLQDKYCENKEKEIKLFPLPVMTRWNSWKIASDYVETYASDIAEYVKTLPDDLKVINYFKLLTDVDVKIIQAEACFLKEHCSVVNELLLLVEGSTYPMAHFLYSKSKEIKASFSVIAKSSRVKTNLGEKTKSLMASLPDEKKKNLEDRIKKLAKAMLTKLEEMMEKDPCKLFFEGAETLFHPVTMMTNDENSVKKAVRNTVFLKSIPASQISVLYNAFKDFVRTALNREATSKEDLIQSVLTGLLATHPEFAIKCLQIIFFSVSNVDSERAFSAYSDVVSAKRCNLLPSNAEIMMSLYFGYDPE